MKFYWMRATFILALFLLMDPVFAKGKLAIAFVSNSQLSAASLFGHLFLVEKIDNTPYPLWQAYEFSAEIPSDQKELFEYLYRGIFGGYQGSYKKIPFHVKITEYLDYEKRDIWLYELNVSSSITKKILKEIEQSVASEDPYYFINQNCASKIYDLIAKKIVGKKRKVWSPQEALQALSDEGLLKEPRRFSPSQIKIENMFSHLDDVEREKVQELFTADLKMFEASISELNIKSKVKPFLRFYYAQKPTKENWNEGWFEKSHLLNKDRENGKRGDLDKIIKNESNPIYRQKMTKFEFKKEISSSGENTFYLGGRPALRSFEDNLFGYEDIKEFELLSFGFSWNKSKIFLRDLTLFSVGVFDDFGGLKPSFSWEIRTEFVESQFIEDNNLKKYGFTEINFGVAKKKSFYHLAFLPKGEVRYTIKEKKYYLGVGAIGRILIRWKKLTSLNSISYLSWKKKGFSNFFGKNTIDYYLSYHSSLFMSWGWESLNRDFLWSTSLGIKIYI